MICQFINKVVVIEKDKIEQCLNFYSDARASFSNLDNVIALLVHVCLVYLFYKTNKFFMKISCL